jgi:hypothetical protein
VLTVDEDVVKVELPENVDHPWRGEGKAVATRLATGAHGDLGPIGSDQRVLVLDGEDAPVIVNDDQEERSCGSGSFTVADWRTTAFGATRGGAADAAATPR